MRQWHVPTHLMCRQHLLGEHVEHHMFVGHIKAGRALGKFLVYGLVEVDTLKTRHIEIVTEMKKRGYNHDDLKDVVFDNILYQGENGRVDIPNNCAELWTRCEKCREIMKNNGFDLEA